LEDSGIAHSSTDCAAIVAQAAADRLAQRNRGGAFRSETQRLQKSHHWSVGALFVARFCAL
jgi:hypothetical protein